MATYPGFFFLCFSDLEVKRCPLVYLIRIWITGWLDFPGGVWKQVSADEVIACHASSFSSSSSSSSCTRSDRFSQKAKTNKKSDMIVCFWRSSASVYVGETKTGHAFVHLVSDRVCVCVCVCSAYVAVSSSTHTYTRTHTHSLIMTLPKWAVCSDTPLAESHSGQT